MTEEILPGIFRMEIPIPRSPLKATNSYLIKGDERNLLIDTGQNTEESLNSLQKGLAELGADMQKTDIFLTHMHADHCGLAPFVKTDASVIYASETDAERINDYLTASSPLDFCLTRPAATALFHRKQKKQLRGIQEMILEKKPIAV